VTERGGQAMFAVPLRDRSATVKTGPRGWTSIIWLLLAAGLLAPSGAAPAGPVCSNPDQSCSQAPPLDQLSLTIDRLKASLRAIRQDLEATRAAAGADETLRATVDRLCAVPLAEARAARDAAASGLEQARATAAGERAEWNHAEAAMTGELISLRGRLAAAEVEVARLTEDRATLVSRIVELDETLEPAASETVAARPWQTSPIHSAEAAEIEAVPQPPLMLGVAPHDQPVIAPPPSAVAAGNRTPASGDPLQLQAELALAQLKIAELSTALESARLRQEAMEAEVGSLRSLTDAKIRQLLGWH
jgi:hypothetical protein